MLMPQLNHAKFIRACRGAGLKHIAQLLGIAPNTVTKKLKDPTMNLYGFMSSFRYVRCWERARRAIGRFHLHHTRRI